MNETIINFLLIFVIMTFTITISRMIMHIGTYFLTKTNYLFMESTREEINNISSQVNNTTDIFQIIRALIENEIMVILEKPIQLHETYNLIKFDEDSNKIGTNVYEALDKDIFKKGNTVLTPEYIQKFIIHETITIFLNSINTHNASIRNTLIIDDTISMKNNINEKR